MLKAVLHKLQGKIPPGHRRSSGWARMRDEHLAQNPVCAACGGAKKLEVHHIKPFHLDPELELEPTNLITLCESKENGMNCHLLIGHLGSYRSYNAECPTDAAAWLKKIRARPK